MCSLSCWRAGLRSRPRLSWGLQPLQFTSSSLQKGETTLSPVRTLRTCAQDCLSCRSLSLPSLQDIPHVHFFHFFHGDTYKTKLLIWDSSHKSCDSLLQAFPLQFPIVKGQSMPHPTRVLKALQVRCLPDLDPHILGTWGTGDPRSTKLSTSQNYVQRNGFVGLMPASQANSQLPPHGRGLLSHCFSCNSPGVKFL